MFCYSRSSACKVFEMPDLARVCEERIKENVNSETVLEILAGRAVVVVSMFLSLSLSLASLPLCM